MKILIISHSFYPSVGGIETVTELLAREFAKMGNEVIVITLTPSISHNEKEFSFKISRNPSFWKLIRLHLWSDIVLQNNISIRLNWPMFFLRKRSVSIIQTWFNGKDNKKRLIGHLKHLSLRHSEVVVAISEAIKNQIRHNNVRVIPNPYDPIVFSQIPVRKSNDFIFLGRLVFDKGADMAISAIQTLNQNGKNYNLTIVGDGPEFKNLKLQVKQCGGDNYISFKGKLQGRQLAITLSEHRFLLVPSRWREPFGIVALEGMASGCIPIVSDEGGLPEVIGDAGIVFTRNNIADLIEKINNLLTDEELQVRLLYNATRRLQLHQPEVVANALLDIMK